MSDVGGTLLDAVIDAVTGRAGAATYFVVLVVASFLLGAQVLANHRYLALGLRVAGLFTLLMALALAINSGGWMSRLDTATTSWFVAHRSMGLDVAATVITDFGSPAATAATGVIIAAVLSWLARSWVPGIVVIATVGAAALANTALKAVIERPRPPLQWQVILETDPSFPSGHVTGTATLLGIVAVVVGMERGRATRIRLTVAVVTAVVLVAATRLYLGVHWLSDVIAGAIMAALFVTIGAAALNVLRRRSGRHDTTTPASPPPLQARP
jgi:membrane-associated phospholipid phosphatase